MKQAYYIVKNGKAESAFELRDLFLPVISDSEVLVEVEAFGINFADIMARIGIYRDAPPLPSIIGYESVGRVAQKGKDVHHVAVGDRVIAFTRFGSYAQAVVTRGDAVVKISEDFAAGKALALATQYVTAYYSAFVATRVMPGDKVLVQAAAGGVGTALTQLCKLRGATVYGTAGSQHKIDYIKSNGVDHAINYQTQDFATAIKEPIDIVFDSLGGEAFKKGMKLLAPGGKMVAFGAANQTDISNIFGKIKFGMDFGVFSPIQLLMKSQAIIGINMLRIADNRPDIMKYCLENLVELSEKGDINPHVGGMYPHTELAQVHDMVEHRKSIGKIGVYWEK
jgi:NADPH:quinone reductase-like Zn-dependent oxidoreductase